MVYNICYICCIGLLRNKGGMFHKIYVISRIPTFQMSRLQRLGVSSLKVKCRKDWSLQIRVIKMLLATMMMMMILCSKGHGPMAPQWARRDHGTQGQPSP